MGLLESLHIAFNSLTANKLRSALTMLGLIIGVGAVISLMSIGQGAQAAVAAQFNSLGTNLVFVSPGTTSQGGVRQAAGSTNTLTATDATALADPSNVPSAAEVSPELTSGGQVIYRNQNTFAQVYGITPAYADVHNYQVASGDWISDTDIQGRAKNVVLGATLAQNLFPGIDPVGQIIDIGSGPRRVAMYVVGVGAPKGGSGFNNPDTAVYVPLTTDQGSLYRARAGAGAEAVSQITLKAVDAQHVSSLEQEISTLLTQRHQATDPANPNDFTVTSQQDQIQTRQQVSQVLTVFLGAVAGISLLVGGIGIMNIMIVSVTERTREIGIRKAIGARRNDILMQFLTESFLISALGGAAGVVAGILMAHLINGRRLNGQVMQTLVSYQSVLLAVGVSAAIGLFFGIYPAARAAQLRPIEALRYE